MGEDYTSGEFVLILSQMDSENIHSAPGPDKLPTRLFSNKVLRPIFAKIFAEMANYIIK